MPNDNISTKDQTTTIINGRTLRVLGGMYIEFRPFTRLVYDGSPMSAIRNLFQTATINDIECAHITDIHEYMLNSAREGTYTRWMGLLDQIDAQLPEFRKPSGIKANRRKVPTSMYYTGPDPRIPVHKFLREELPKVFPGKTTGEVADLLGIKRNTFYKITNEKDPIITSTTVLTRLVQGYREHALGQLTA